MSKVSVCTVGAALATLSVPAFAQSAPPPGVAQGTAPLAAPHLPPMGQAPAIMQMKMRMSGRVMTRAEVAQHVRAMFSRLDANHDNYLTHDEVAAFRGPMMSGMHGAMTPRMVEERMEMHSRDAGMVMPDPNKMFDRLDTNHDGVISRQEFTAGHHEMHERRIVMLRGPEGQGGHDMHAMGGGFGEHLFAMADANHDDRVSLQEAEAAALAHFDRVDVNHDGTVTPEERRQAHQATKGHRKL